MVLTKQLTAQPPFLASLQALSIRFCIQILDIQTLHQTQNNLLLLLISLNDFLCCVPFILCLGSSPEFRCLIPIEVSEFNSLEDLGLFLDKQ